MKKLKVGDKVVDRWFPYWGVGVVKKILKTRYHIDFGADTMVFDYPHARMFLKKWKNE